MPLNPIAIRDRFPALRRTHHGLPVAYLDGPGGSQMVDSCIDGITRYLRAGAANLHGAFATSHDTDALLAEARAAGAALLGAAPGEVAFGQNMTSLAFAIASALGPTWGEGDNIVVTELDHRANVDPWARAAMLAGAQVRYLPVDAERLVLDMGALPEVITDRTRLVAVGRASNAVGTVTDVAAIARQARSVGALVAVDAVHATPHLPMDRDELGADFLFCSGYKFFGPHIGVVAIRQEVFDRLAVARLAPAPTSAPDKLETGTQNHEGLAGLLGAISFIASLGAGTTLRQRLVAGVSEIREWEDALAAGFRKDLASIPGLRLHGAQDEVEKTPTIAFTLAGHSPHEVASYLGDRGVFVGDGNFYASTLDERLGTLAGGGWVRVGLAPYTTRDELARCLNCVSDLAS
jgi:cysteine desulfurase family protein (TIGR01976 family)